MAAAWTKVFTTAAITRNCFTVAGEDIRLLAMTIDDPMANPGPMEKEFFDCNAVINMWFIGAMQAKAFVRLQSVGSMGCIATARLVLMTAALCSWIFKWQDDASLARHCRPIFIDKVDACRDDNDADHSMVGEPTMNLVLGCRQSSASNVVPVSPPTMSLILNQRLHSSDDTTSMFITAQLLVAIRDYQCILHLIKDW